MNVVDSSAWLEYFAGTAQAEKFSKAIEDTKNLVVPVIVIYEVFKKILSQRDENSALIAIAHIQQGKVVEIDSGIALAAAKISHEKQMPMADSIILAAAKRFNATLWTQDVHFKDIPGVKYFTKGKE